MHSFTMYNTFQTIISRLKNADKGILLGRWKLDYCTTILQRKVTMTNEDHCGICENSIIQENRRKRKEEEKIFQSMITELYI